MKLYKNVFIVLMLLMALLSILSCDNTVSVKSENYEVSMIKPDLSLTQNSGTGEKNISVSIEGTDFMIKMNPAWNNDDNSTIYGDTGDNYISIDNLDSIGYFAQGIWKYWVKAYYNQKEIYTYSGQVEINKYNRTISIDPSSLIVSDNSNSVCNIKLSSFDILLVESLDKYNVEVEGGFRYTVGVKSLEDGSDIITDKVITKDCLSSTNGIIASISSTGVEVCSISNGAYEISIQMDEWTWSDTLNEWHWEKTGGTSCSFVGIPGAPVTISGIQDEIDLYPSDYVTPGAGSGIEIESGIQSSVNVKAYKGVVSEGTLVSSTVSVTTSDTVILVPEVANGPSNISTYKWFVDGVEQEGTSINSGNLTFTPTRAKTYTITYMFLDGTNYNTISGNCYLTVTAS